MRAIKGLVATALILPVTACIPAMDAGYPYSSYSGGGGIYDSSVEYSAPTVVEPRPVINTYHTTYQAAPVVVTHQRPVPSLLYSAEPSHDRSNGYSTSTVQHTEPHHAAPEWHPVTPTYGSGQHDDNTSSHHDDHHHRR
jgi:hypothetical protein